MGWKSVERTLIRLGAGDMMNLGLAPAIGSFGSEEAGTMPSRSGPVQSSDGGLLSPVADPAIPKNRTQISNPGSCLVPALGARRADQVATLGTRSRYLLSTYLADALESCARLVPLRLLGGGSHNDWDMCGSPGAQVRHSRRALGWNDPPDASSDPALNRNRINLVLSAVPAFDHPIAGAGE